MSGELSADKFPVAALATGMDKDEIRDAIVDAAWYVNIWTKQ